jgi:hypothetical protein
MRGLVTGTLIATLGAAGSMAPAQPAQAQSQTNVWVNLTINVHATFGGGGIDQAALDAAVREIKAAIAAAKTEIIFHIDAALVVFADTCVQGFAVRAENLDRYSGDTLQQEANRSVDCALFVSNTLRTVQDRRLAEHVGQLVGPMNAMAAALNARAGFTINGLLANYASVSEAMIGRLAPECREWIDWSDPDHNIGMYLFYTCTGADGVNVSAIQWLSDIDGRPTTPLMHGDLEVTREWVRDKSGERSSWAVARATLPRLRALGF